MTGEGMKREAAPKSREMHLLLAERLALLGLRDVEQVLTHTNRTVMLSLHRRVLRVHRGYSFASDRVLRAIVRFLDPRVSRARRRRAEQEFLAFPVESYAPPREDRRSSERPRPGDVALLHRLEALHQTLNRAHFDGELGSIGISLSSRMRTRLGELSADVRSGRPLQITISRRHLLRHDWQEVEHTMLHEMVHQWQAENGLRIDHGPTFRRKAREVGVIPAARRTITLPGHRGRDAATA